MGHASRFNTDTFTPLSTSGAIRAVAARCQANRRRMIFSGLSALCLAVLVVASLLAPEVLSGRRGEWLSFVTLPATLLLLWALGRLGLLAMNHKALRQDRREIENRARMPTGSHGPTRL